MRENRSYGSEGGGTEFNRSFLPLSLERRSFSISVPSVTSVVKIENSDCRRAM